MPSSLSLSGFSVIPVTYSTTSTHYIYARAHSSSNASGSSLPEGRTLFIVNVPPDATEREIILFFKPCGTVERVVFDLNVNEVHHEDSEDDDEPSGDKNLEKTTEPPNKRRKITKEAPQIIPLPPRNLRTLRRSGQAAHVVFLDPSSLERALDTAQKPQPWPTSEEPMGLAHYTQLYHSLRPPLDVIQEHADSSIEAYKFELAKSKQKSRYKKGEAIVDEDGFTLVTRGGTYGKTLGGGVAVASKRFQRTGQTRNRPQKKESKEKEGFYGFQKAEKQRQELINLKKKWEEDKAKVEKLKSSRKFKPY